MNAALRGWRRKGRPTFEQFDRDFTRFTDRLNKHSFMCKVRGRSYGRPQLIHKGGKP